MSSLLTMPMFNNISMFRSPFKMARDRSGSISKSVKPSDQNQERRSRERPDALDYHKLARSENHSEESQTLDNRIASCSSDYSSSNVSMARSTLSQEDRRTKILKFWDKKLQR